MRKLFYDEEMYKIKEVEVKEIPTTEKMFCVLYEEDAQDLRTREIVCYGFTVTIDKEKCYIPYKDEEQKEKLKYFCKRAGERDGSCFCYDYETKERFEY